MPQLFVGSYYPQLIRRGDTGENAGGLGGSFKLLVAHFAKLFACYDLALAC